MFNQLTVKKLLLSGILIIILLTNTALMPQYKFEILNRSIKCEFNPDSGELLCSLVSDHLDKTYSIKIDGLKYDNDFQKLFTKLGDNSFSNDNTKINFEIISERAIAITWFVKDEKFHNLNLIIQSESETAYYGSGERFNSLNQHGYMLPMQSADRYGSKGVGAYKSVPFVMSSKGFGFWVDSFAEGIFDINSTDRTKFKINYDEKRLRVVLIAGPKYCDILSEFISLTGEVRIPPQWSFGLWKSRDVHPNQDSVYVDIAKLRKYDIPASVIVIDSPWETGYNDFEVNQTQFTNPIKMFNAIVENGFYPCVWLTPFINKKNIIDAPGIDSITSTFEVAKEKGFLVKSSDGKVAMSNWWKGEGGLVDFTNPQAKDWWLTQLLKTQKYGIHAFKVDDGEGSFISDAIFYDGSDVKYMRNKYSIEYNTAMQNYIDNFLDSNGVLITRSGFTGVQATPFSWAGDNRGDFSMEDGLPSVIIAGQNAGMSGIPFWGSDISGYAGTPTKEVFIRWTQFAVFTPFMQVHMTSNLGPWDFDSETLNIFRKFAKLRMQLIPYIYFHAEEAKKTGMPLIRSMALAFQNDEQAVNCDYQYMFGNDLLVAPIYQYGEHRSIYLPVGEWIYYWDGKIYEGKQNIEVYAPISDIPIFIKSGSVIPLFPEDVNTLIPRHGKMKHDIKTVDDRRILQIWTDNIGSSFEYEGIKLTKKITKTGYEINLISANKLNIELRFMFTNIAGIKNERNENIPININPNYVSCSFNNFKGEQIVSVDIE